MQMKPRRPFQIVALASALSLFMSYVVYSQLQHTRTIASSSKSMTLALPASSPGTNIFSKTIKSAATDRADASTNAARATNVGVKAGPMVFPGSKSAAVFTFQPTLTSMQQQVAAPSSKTNTLVTTKRKL
jgi:hypothetical protein